MFAVFAPVGEAWVGHAQEQGSARKLRSVRGGSRKLILSFLSPETGLEGPDDVTPK